MPENEAEQSRLLGNHLQRLIHMLLKAELRRKDFFYYTVLIDHISDPARQKSHSPANIIKACNLPVHIGK